MKQVRIYIVMTRFIVVFLSLFKAKKNVASYKKKDIQIGIRPVPYIPHYVIGELFV